MNQSFLKKDDFDLTRKILEKQNEEKMKQVKEHKEKISRVVLEIEEILIREGFRWNDWGEVCQKFNDRNEYIFPRMTIKEIKERHDEFTK